MAVMIGHASIDERGKAYGGSAGDQTKKEVYTRTWYNKPWHTVFRPKSAEVAEKIAKAMEQACANNNIGYDQHQRTTLFSAAKAAAWDISKVTQKCETDCSALVSVCCNAAGIAISKDMWTGNEKSCLAQTGKFTLYTSTDYTHSSAKLQRGDILLGNGHTAIVLSNGSATPVKKQNTVKSAESAASFSKAVAGKYKVTASALNVRTGAGVGKKILCTIPNATAVTCYGYYTTVAGTKWLYVKFTYGGTTYTGFASSKYLKK